MAAHELFARNLPSHDVCLAIWSMGFPVAPAAIRQAWSTQLGKIKQNFDSRIKRAERLSGSPFSALEDEISELATSFARKLSKQFGLDRIEITQAVIDLFGLTFGSGYVVDVDQLEQIIEFMILVLPMPIKTPYSTRHEGALKDVFSTLQFLEMHMTFGAVEEIVKSMTDLEIAHAQRRWRKIFKLVQCAWPELATDGHLSKMLAVGFGRLFLPTIIQFIRDGKMPEIDRSITEIGKLVARTEMGALIGKLIQGNDIDQTDKMALKHLSATLQTLADIWAYHDFPFTGPIT